MDKHGPTPPGADWRYKWTLRARRLTEAVETLIAHQHDAHLHDKI